MFDIGFFELLVIAVVGLLVIGPERLPETIRTVLLAVGRIKRGLTETRQELERQIGADDIRRQLHNEEIMARLEQTQQGIRREIDDTLQAADAPASVANTVHSDDSSQSVAEVTDATAAAAPPASQATKAAPGSDHSPSVEQRSHDL